MRCQRSNANSNFAHLVLTLLQQATVPQGIPNQLETVPKLISERYQVDLFPAERLPVVIGQFMFHHVFSFKTLPIKNFNKNEKFSSIRVRYLLEKNSLCSRQNK